MVSSSKSLLSDAARHLSSVQVPASSQADCTSGMTSTRDTKRRWCPGWGVPMILLAALLHGATTLEIGWSLDKMFEEYGDIGTFSTVPSWPVLKIEANTTFTENVFSFGLGGISQFYGAGSVSPIHSATGTLDVQFNAMVPGFGLMGSSCLHPRNDMTLDDFNQRTQSALLNHVETVLWASIILRDNLVTVFGYILNLPGNPLSSDLYTSLFHIYNEVRHRRFPIVDLMTELNEICHAQPAEQLEKILRKMKKVCRPYLESSIEIWLRHLPDLNIHFEDIFQPKGEPLVVDILEGIYPSVLVDSARLPEFPHEVVSTVDSVSKEMVGGTVAYTLRALQTGALHLTQTLFALMLQSRPLEKIDPQLTESERYVTDSLRVRTVLGWNEIVQKALESGGTRPFAFARAALWALAESPEVEVSLSDAARLVHSYVDPPDNTYFNPHYHFTSSIMSKPFIDVLKVLKAITHFEYPEDVVDAKDRITYYIESGYLDMEFVVKGFNRFDHTKPIDVLIAILTRIERRLPKLPHEIRSSVKYLKVALLFKKSVFELYPRIPDEFLESSFLLDAFKGPTMPKDIRFLVKELDAKLSNVDIPVSELIDQVPIEECSRPRQCILNIYRRVTKNGYVHGSVKELLLKLLSKLDINGDPLHPLVLPEFEVKTDKKKKCHKKKGKPEREHHKEKKKLKYKDRFAFKPAVVSEEDAEPVEESQTLYVGPPMDLPRNFFPVLNISELSAKPDYDNLLSLLPFTEDGSLEDIKLRPIRAFLKGLDVAFHLGQSFRPQAHETKRDLLLAILKRAVSSFAIVIDSMLHNTIKEYLWFLENLPHNHDIIHQSVFPNVNEEWEISPVTFEEPFKNLPDTVEGTLEYEKLQPIRWFLSQEDLYYQLGPYFKSSIYHTKGSFLRKVLLRALQLKSVRKNFIVYITIKQFLAHLEDASVHPQEVKLTPFPILEAINFFEPPNWEHQITLLPPTISGTAEHVKLRALRKFFKRKDFWNILGSSFRPHNYHTKGELLIACLGHMLTLDFVKENNALALLTQEYLAFLQSHHEGLLSGPSSIKLNVDSLLKALPYPVEPEEKDLFGKLKEYFKLPHIHTEITQLVSKHPSKTRGDIMKLVMENAVGKVNDPALDNVTSRALHFFKDRVYFHGYGAQAVDYLFHEKPLSKVRFDIFDLFRAIDHNRLSAEDRKRLKRVMKFVSKKFNPKKYLANFEMEKYKKKGEFLEASFHHMSQLEFLSPTLQEDMTVLRKFVLKTGPGDELLVVLEEQFE